LNKTRADDGASQCDFHNRVGFISVGSDFRSKGDRDPDRAYSNVASPHDCAQRMPVTTMHLAPRLISRSVGRLGYFA
jgi:hypothetical protein